MAEQNHLIDELERFLADGGEPLEPIEIKRRNIYRRGAVCWVTEITHYIPREGDDREVYVEIRQYREVD